ncbi:MAG: hypothetical protein RBT34_05640 [Anaerolineaceae bacterium]|jgi:hypothetical protein|nr:hypothetical protein [Anaerolineaceae bacterium]
MKKNFLTVAFLLFFLAGCGSGSRLSSNDVLSSVVMESYDIQSIDLSYSQILPPYGVTVKTGTLVLNLMVSTSEKETAERFTDIQKAIDVITKQAAESGNIALTETSIVQINSSYQRKDSSLTQVQNVDASAVRMKLSIDISQHGNDFIKSVTAFNEFLNGLTLDDTITLKAISLEADLGDLAAVRLQIIEQIYAEMNAVKDEQGEAVKFEVSGLYAPLQKMQLNDLAYYLYLEPVITIIEY